MADLGVDVSDGTPFYEERRGDAELEWRLGAPGPLVVVAGPRRSGTSRAAARAARALLGDHVVVGHGSAASGLTDLVSRAELAMGRERAPGAVVWLDGADLATLDAITPAVVAALPAGVRIVVTVEELLLCSWFPDPGTVGLLTAAGTLVRFGPRADGATGLEAVRTALTPAGWASLRPLAIARAAGDWRRAGVPRVLDRGHLLDLARVHRHLLGLGDTAVEDKALAAALDGVAAQETRGVRLLRRSGSGPREHYAGVRGADLVADGAPPAAWPLSPALAAPLDRVLDGADRDVVARTLLLRGAHDVVVRLVEDGWGHPNPTQAGELAAAATRAGRPARAWHGEALGSASEAHVLAARRALAPRLSLRIVTRAPCRPDPVVIPHPREPADTTPTPDRTAVQETPETEEAQEQRRWDDARPTFDHADAAIRWALVGRDLDGARHWLAIMENTDPPALFSERVAARRRQVEDLVRTAAR